MVINQELRSDLAIPPGEYLEEVLEEFGMTKNELAKRMNRPAPKLSAIFKGEKAITPDTALRLEKVVGVPAHIWIGLESEYRLALARKREIKEEDRLKAESKLVTKYRYADLVKLGMLKKFTRPAEKVIALQKFFGVTSLKTVPVVGRYQAAFRIGKKLKGSGKSEAIASWLRIGELAAAKIHCAPFKKSALENATRQIRKLTRKSRENFQDELQQLLAESGVALVLCPYIAGTGIHGATFWMGQEKGVVMMTTRYKWADIFWFSLFHELGHILLHGPTTIVLEGADDDPKIKKQEEEADKYAAEVLIPPKLYKKFIAVGKFFPNDIKCFSDQIDIDPGVVVGRLQNDGFLERAWHNGLRTGLDWKEKLNIAC